jgi:hypothetical protein
MRKQSQGSPQLDALKCLVLLFLSGTVVAAVVMKSALPLMFTAIACVVLVKVFRYLE